MIGFVSCRIWTKRSGLLRSGSGSARTNQLRIDRVDGGAHFRFERLHVDVRCRRGLGVPHHPLDVLDVTLFGLAKRGDGAADDLECQLRQTQFSGQFVQHAMTIVARIHRSAKTPREHKGVRRRVLALLPAFLSIIQDLVRQNLSYDGIKENFPQRQQI